MIEVVPYEHVDIPTLSKVREARARELAPVSYRPRPSDIVQYDADDRVQQVTLTSEV